MTAEPAYRTSPPPTLLGWKTNLSLFTRLNFYELQTRSFETETSQSGLLSGLQNTMAKLLLLLMFRSTLIGRHCLDKGVSGHIGVLALLSQVPRPSCEALPGFQ